MSTPTFSMIHQVLQEYRRWVHVPSTRAKEQGAIVAIPGGLNCPWCDQPGNKKLPNSWIIVCKRDSSHVYEWLPWGG